MTVAQFDAMFPDETACKSYLQAPPLAGRRPLPALRQRQSLRLAVASIPLAVPEMLASGLPVFGHSRNDFRKHEQ
ncbi:MAG: hypothetical protein WB822_12120, partial [Rhodoplanes sp.]